MFTHRAYWGWITDLATAPHPHASWPSIALDEALMADYDATFAHMKRIGLNEIGIWGLALAGAWPVDIEGAISPSRKAMVAHLIDRAHARDIKVLAGLGVYSWGFEEIIAANPGLSRGNPRAMCASNPETWPWQQRIVDALFHWDIDGVTMQSADQGRCPCEECAVWGDVEYHMRLNIQVADYIKKRWPGKVVGVNNWGVTYEHPDDFPYHLELGKHVDYIVDAHDTARRAGDDYVRKLITAVPCAWGTNGGFAVEPPQHWERDRWFLPCLESAATHIDQLRDDGSAVCELFFRIAANPGDEISLLTCGRLLADRTGDWRQCLRASVMEVYRPRTDSACTALTDLFLRAEAAYFDNARNFRRVGTLSLEPLKSDRPGPPVYLLDHMNLAALDRYETTMHGVAARARQLTGSVDVPARVHDILACIEGVQGDIASARTALRSV